MLHVHHHRQKTILNATTIVFNLLKFYIILYLLKTSTNKIKLDAVAFDTTNYISLNGNSQNIFVENFNRDKLKNIPLTDSFFRDTSQ